jgi:pimeloyl-ACP methyl ester carboxylesterase
MSKYLSDTLTIIFSLLSTLMVTAGGDEPEAGKVIRQVSCRADSDHHYALYLPSDYHTSDNEYWPVIYAFDAAGRGSLPVELFSEAAETFGYIIAGSNISENGPWETILKATEMMITDIESRFKVDKARRYAAGFSGGARVAAALAVMYGTFEGVIGCGAGFSPNYPPNFDMQFSYIGLIGNRDYNYQEMMLLDDKLSTFRIDHYICEFPGSHEWPPAPVLTDAVHWLHFKAMKNDLIWIDYGMREDFYDLQLSIINKLLDEERKYDAYMECLKTLSYLDWIRRMGEIRTMADDLWKSPEVKDELRNKRGVLEEERAFYHQYHEAFAAYRYNLEDSMTPIKPAKWWKEQLKIAHNKILKGKTPADTLMGHRMIDFMWRSAYMNYESVQGSRYQSLSRFYLDIWALVQPEAVSPYFFMARTYAREGKSAKALKELEKAINRGLDDPSIIENDPWMATLHPFPEYQRLVNKISGF